MPDLTNGEIPHRTLGRTGERVSAIGLGGWHLGLKQVDEKLSIRIVRTAIDSGINFMDNSWDYNNGASERRMGKALRAGYRGKVFLMTKIDGRSRKAATNQLNESLRRLQTDCIDLVQHHEIIRFEDPHRIFDEEGVQGALEEARKAGKLRYIGFTGHKDPRVHLHMLEVAKERGARMDTVQMPLNVMDAHYRSFGKLVIPELGEGTDRGAGDEEHGERRHTQVEDRHGHRVPALRVEPADISGDHRGGQHEDPQAGAGSGPHVPADVYRGSGCVARQNRPCCD